MKICFASNNPHKLEEIRQLMPAGFEVVSLTDLGVLEEIEETGSMLEENSMLKAEYVYNKHRIPVFADDSGLEVEALGGEPGVYSARYAGPQKNSEDNMDLLLEKLGDAENRSACFKAIITYIDETGTAIQFEGRVDGEIRKQKTGNGGFGYDPIFQPSGYDVTFAEMSDEEKNAISHRGRAIEKFMKYLTER